MRVSRVPILIALFGFTLLYSQRNEEAEEFYQKWLNQDVVYLITPEERRVFEELTTAEEKERFIVQFWHRRDPNLSTSANEFKEEHYRRIAYANDNFKSGIDGWKTDRGEIYIVYGPPSSRERYPTGGLYQRPIQEGGGFTSTYAREVWYYEHIEGIGPGVAIEFVDPTGSGEYRLVLRETERDALLFVPSAGNTLFEDLGIETRAGRIRSSMAMRSLGLKGDVYGNPAANPFIKLERYMALTQPRRIEFTDLKALVETRVHYNNLSFDFRYDVFRYSDETVLCPVTIGIKDKELTSQTISGSGKQHAAVEIYGQVQNLNRQVVYEFEELTSAAVGGSGRGEAIYQRLVPLSPGRYKINLVLKEKATGKLGSTEALIVVPKPGGTLSTSTLVLADRILPAWEEEVLSDPFVTVGGLKVYPNVRSVFREDEPIGLYLEVYNLQLDPRTSRPDVGVVFQLRRADSGQVVESRNITSSSLAFRASRATIARMWRDLKLETADYIMALSIEDHISGQVVNAQGFFSVIKRSE